MAFQYLKKVFDGISQTVDEFKDLQDKNDIDFLINLIKNKSISCNNCNALAAPIFDTRNSYKCIKCARQFHGQNHFINHEANQLIKSKSFFKASVDAGPCYNKALTRI